ncbi:hypothetical protein U1Q18_011587 [Sarracenia purpurea var. burkii]
MLMRMDKATRRKARGKLGEWDYNLRLGRTEKKMRSSWESSFKLEFDEGRKHSVQNQKIKGRPSKGPSK